MALSRIKTILAADIGGTRSRFALFHFDQAKGLASGALSLVRKVQFPTTSSKNTVDMMRTLASMTGNDGGYFTPESPEPVMVDAAVFGIPGPTVVANPVMLPPKDEVCYCPNMEWPLEATPVTSALSGVPVRFINDFVANGFACAFLGGSLNAVTVLQGEGRPGFARAVVGAGTGLGHCLILPGDPVTVIGSEAGHTIFPFTSEEADIARYFAAHYGTADVDGDMTVAGQGLSILYEYCTGEKHHPHTVAPLAAQNPEVIALAARFYGRAVRHYVLSTLALGGVFITGGLAANLPSVLSHPAFAAELRGCQAMSHILTPVPVHHVRNPDAGLWGAASCAALALYSERRTPGTV